MSTKNQYFFKFCAKKKICHDTIPTAYQNQLEQYCNEINTGMNFTEEIEKISPEQIDKSLSEKTAMKKLVR